MITNGQLENTYQTLLGGVLTLPESNKLSPPLLLREFDAYSQSKSKLMIFGQETLGWSFVKGEYYDWPFPDIRCFADFSKCENGAQAYSSAYEKFDFSKYQPDNYRSPFWRMYRGLKNRIENDADRSIVWNNVLKLAYDGGSPLGSDISQKDLNFIIAFSKQLIEVELSHFAPKNCVFFTGPNYDFILRDVFEDLEFQDVDGYPPVYFSKLKSRRLPENSFRTYHPAYLNRTQKFDEMLDLLESKIKENTPL